MLPNHQHTLKIQSWCYQTTSTPWRYSLGATKPPAHPEDTVLVLPNHQHTRKIQSWFYKTTNTPWRYSLGSTKPPTHPEDTVLVLPNHQHTLKIQSWFYQTTNTTWRCSLSATKPPTQPEDAVLVLPSHQQTLKMGTELGTETTEKTSQFDAVVCPRKFHWILSPRKLQDLFFWICFSPKMKAGWTSETSIKKHQSIRHNKSEGLKVQQHSCEVRPKHKTKQRRTKTLAT